MAGSVVRGTTENENEDIWDLMEENVNEGFIEENADGDNADVLYDINDEVTIYNKSKIYFTVNASLINSRTLLGSILNTIKFVNPTEYEHRIEIDIEYDYMVMLKDYLEYGNWGNIRNMNFFKYKYTYNGETYEADFSKFCEIFRFNRLFLYPNGELLYYNAYDFPYNDNDDGDIFDYFESNEYYEDEGYDGWF